MKSLLWLAAMIVLLSWGMGFFIMAAKPIIHSLLALGMAIVVYNLNIPRKIEV